MSIPIESIVSTNPRVIGAGGSALSLNGVFLSKNPVLPSHKVEQFFSADDVSVYFGANSDEASLARVYFLGFDNSTIKPGLVYFAPYVDVTRSAWLRSGSLLGMTLAQLQSLNGSLTINVNGIFQTGDINLASATSFSDGASIIQAGFSPGVLTVDWNSDTATFQIFAAGTPATTTIDFATNSLSQVLKFTEATGAELSQGATTDTPQTAMDNVKNNTQDWVLFTTLFLPSLSDKLAFAQWAEDQNQRYGYVGWDNDPNAIISGNTDNFGIKLKSSQYNCAEAVYNTKELSAFVLGTTACIDTLRRNGRITYAFKFQGGFTPTVTDATTANILLQNGYSFYGRYGSPSDATNTFDFFYNGQISGRWKWLDSFVNQVWINASFRAVLMNLLLSTNSIPYDSNGYSMIYVTMQDIINQAINFGAIRVGITLSNAQRAQVNQEAGVNISQNIETQGCYLQILDPPAPVRVARQSPIINFWYTDGGAIQRIIIDSIAIL